MVALLTMAESSTVGDRVVPSAIHDVLAAAKELSCLLARLIMQGTGSDQGTNGDDKEVVVCYPLHQPGQLGLISTWRVFPRDENHGLGLPLAHFVRYPDLLAMFREHFGHLHLPIEALPVVLAYDAICVGLPTLCTNFRPGQQTIEVATGNPVYLRPAPWFTSSSLFGSMKLWIVDGTIYACTEPFMHAYRPHVKQAVLEAIDLWRHPTFYVALPYDKTHATLMSVARITAISHNRVTLTLHEGVETF